MPSPALPLPADAAPAVAVPVATSPEGAPESSLFPGFPARGPRRWTPYVWVFVCWTGVGVFFGARAYVNNALFNGRFLADPRPLVGNLFDAYMWACLTLLIFRAASAFPFNRRGRRVAAFAVHSVLATALGVFSVVMNLAFGNLQYPEDPGTFQTYFGRAFYFNVMWYVVLVGVWHAMDYYRRWRDREVQAARLGTQLAQAQLDALKMQIQPHFLFNTLHAISELVHEDPDAADRMITRLGDLLRLTVDNAGTHEVTLRQEMEFLRAYLEIQQSRFQDSLEVNIRTDPDAMDALVPNLVLQPLVENAIHHGIAPRGGIGRIDITARRVDGLLELEVRDNGRGLPMVRERGGREGVGVRNTRARLQQMYGDACRLELANGAEGGVAARVVLPYHAAGAAGGAA